ncbi:hypothetical protein [Mycolicibacterium thermoresistibile]|uniref:Uncharacterized protein n=2 Tax=Mycolicibacterium thermoresistibile TaxID=1797 RepID=G7CFY8_MYCT3|nr:hypothetical protein [Mycolicibacterium thermoresistibile]EHI13417.1 hypothetical protein KEK_09547 [Mycolicibacterium thermoresistibile ATCC 19527]MCV7188814.1 hypothetical protein [Mycolicibacterium thermoresistibile]GAT16648.1 putative uncharacterized protein [Mycolicibacterium thermoresistibile]SNW18708.1 Uncharacterised protein [Mycolicibacterium thermoresistibile]
MDTDTDITVPDRLNPAALIVAAGSPRAGTLRDVLRVYADQLTAIGCFADLTACDTSTVAAFIAWDVVHGEESPALRQRSAAVAEGAWAGWDNPVGVARVFRAAATVLDA